MKVINMYKLIVICYLEDGSKITYTYQSDYIRPCYDRISEISKQFKSVHYEMYKLNGFKYELQEKGEFNERS